MKKILVLFLISFSLIMFGCANSSETKTQPTTTSTYVQHYVGDMYDDAEFTKTSILKDKNFENGFYVRGLGLPIYGDPIETFGELYESNTYFTYGTNNRPKWRLCQWASRYPFHDTENTSTEVKNGVETFNYRYTLLGENHHLFENQSKTLEVDTTTGEIRLALKASECYKEDRVFGQEWPHLLLEQYICSSADAACKVSNSKAIEVKMDVKINEFIDYMDDRANPGLHAASLMFYVFVANFDPEKKSFTDMLWLGMTIFDNRTPFGEFMSRADGYKESATNKWIYNIEGHNYFSEENNLYDTDGNILFNEWKTADIDLLPFIRESFDVAQSEGYMANSRWENLYINGMYIGFELPGTYDLDMSIKNMDIITIKRK